MENKDLNNIKFKINEELTASIPNAIHNVVDRNGTESSDVMIEGDINTELFSTIATLNCLNDDSSLNAGCITIETDGMFNNMADLNIVGRKGTDLSDVMIEADINKEPFSAIATLNCLNDDSSLNAGHITVETDGMFNNIADLNIVGRNGIDLSDVMIEADINTEPFSTIAAINYINDGISPNAAYIGAKAEDNFGQNALISNSELDDQIMKSVGEAAEKFGKPIFIDQEKIRIKSYSKTFRPFSKMASHQINVVVVNLINVEGDVYENDINLII
ncbi:MAG: hypothetical protein WD607_10420 [Candidatus Paceibacterota bacterium]